jgi:TPP-dependent 2-oxoacid decarboxylase
LAAAMRDEVSARAARLRDAGVVPTLAIVLVGDGAFQMTGLELSNMVRYGLDPIVVLFNNAGFGQVNLEQSLPIKSSADHEENQQ